MRIGIKFSREGAAKFVSHLDMQRVFSRALRRTGMHVKYSQGFNPHIVLSFASALPVGMATQGDYMEFSLTDSLPVDQVAARLHAQMPEGMRICKAGELPETAPKLMAAVRMAEVEILSPGDALPQALKAFMAREHCVVQKRSGKKLRELDIRPLVYGATFFERGAIVRLAHSGAESLSPALLWQALELPGEGVFIRRELFTAGAQDDFVPLYMLFV